MLFLCVRCVILSYITLKCTTVFWRGIYCKGLIIVTDTGVLCWSLLEQVFYFLLLVTNRNGNRPTESMKSHAFFVCQMCDIKLYYFEMYNSILAVFLFNIILVSTHLAEARA